MHLASALKLNATHVDAAFRFFMLAVQHNFTQGRRTPNVIAACLYIVCRRHKTPHMLIDFSDVLQANLFVLGNTFFRLCQTLGINPPLIDPSLYIHRFAASLELGDSELEIANTALRLVQRMKRDWIQIGRRPAGVCGAALFIASRIHRVPVQQQAILRTVKVCDITLRRRVGEFKNLPSAKLTFSEFKETNPEHKGDPEDDLTDKTSENPPIFKYHEKKRAEAVAASTAAVADAETGMMELTEELIDAQTVDGTKKSNQKKRAASYDSLETPDAKRAASTVAVNGAASATMSVVQPPTGILKATKTIDSSTQKANRQEMEKLFDEMIDKENRDDLDGDKGSTFGLGVEEQWADALKEAKQKSLGTMSVNAANAPPMEIPIGTQTTAIESVPTEEQTESHVETMDGSDIPDSEVEEYLNTPEEVEIKEIVWGELNRDYLEAQQERERVAAQLIAEGRAPKKRTRASRAAGDRGGSNGPVGELAEAPPKERSRKLNYEALDRAKQQRTGGSSSSTRAWLEGFEDNAAGGEDDDDDHFLAPAPPVRPPPSAFLGSLRPTIPDRASQATTQTTIAYDDDDDDEDEEVPLTNNEYDSHFKVRNDDDDYDYD
jgi:transcription factor IIIB subunit 2